VQQTFGNTSSRRAVKGGRHGWPGRFGAWARLGTAATAIGALARQARCVGWARAACGLGDCVVGGDVVLSPLVGVAGR
jgi:hypothetical protein